MTFQICCKVLFQACLFLVCVVFVMTLRAPLILSCCQNLCMHMSAFFSSPTLFICLSFFIVCDDPWVFVGWDEDFYWTAERPFPNLYIYLSLSRRESRGSIPGIVHPWFCLAFYGVLPAVFGRCDWSEML
ncbi:uncharacterized protein BO66DRAFT_104843 [Aspergillus aculeatinus CBS 121060]|uniref:Uncharacterized protein n=1 Tax=Aspergillus aculeatinus CBS 121060 TaxID=1448322 RepID=A0ACD1H6V1_9EURO|nr:hypothetical protein BO66DRAFT_104843 [Aspergillus aculeatinus CBS 121060]RAH69342.1 hypothetical protein BO66DRAFT_104843 [Aspergillus aculeatinus CBS 121060]